MVLLCSPTYVRPEVRDFREVIEIFKADLPTLASSLFKSEKDKRREAVEKIRASLTEQLNKNQDKLNSDFQNSFTNYCDSATINITKYFDELIGELESITQDLKTANSQINQANIYLNQAYAKRIIDWCVEKYEPLTDNR